MFTDIVAIEYVNSVEAAKLAENPHCYDHQKTDVIDNTGSI